jgi:rhodanese-related sulfurtransferase
VNLFRQVVVLLLLAAAVAAGLRAWQPAGLAWSGPVPGPGEITLAQARALAQTRPVVWVDARSAAAFAAGHIPQAVNLQESAWDAEFSPFLNHWTPDSAVVVYCDDAGCHASEQVAARLRDRAGLPEVYVLFGGWEAAQSALQNGQWKGSP